MTSGPQKLGAPPRTCLSAFVGASRTIFWQNDIRFCWEMTFPGNLSLAMIVLGEFTRKYAYKIECGADPLFILA
jgi:hypothetical protein